MSDDLEYGEKIKNVASAAPVELVYEQDIKTVFN